MEIASERMSTTGAPFGALPTHSVGKSEPRLEVVPPPPPVPSVTPSRPPVALRAKPTAPRPPRARALAVVVAFGVGWLAAAFAAATLLVRL